MDTIVYRNITYQVIATRDLWYRDESGQDTPVKVFIGAPEQIGHDTYSCAYQILGIGKILTGRMEGVDSVQSLILALNAVGAELFALRERWGKKIWHYSESDNDPDLGFPLPESLKQK